MMTIEKFMKEFCDNHQAPKNHEFWINSHRQEWMTDDQWLLALFLCRLFKGFHHCPYIKKSNCGSNNLVINTSTAYFANYDYDYLTKAVIMGHNWGVRVCISGSGPGMFKLSLWKRSSRVGNICDRMPTIEEMIEKYKDY